MVGGAYIPGRSSWTIARITAGSDSPLIVFQTHHVFFEANAQLGLDDEVAGAIMFNAVDATSRNGNRVTRRDPPLLVVQGKDALTTEWTSPFD